MRDHRKLHAFQLADSLALAAYRETTKFPDCEKFGLTSQMRRAAVSAAANIVEGCARRGEKDFARFIEIAFGSLREMEYYIHLANRLGYMTDAGLSELSTLQQRAGAATAALLKSVRRMA